MKGAIMPQRRKYRYGFFKLCGDLLMLALTSGLWAIWIIVREIRYR
jgi:hypothetical protein